MCHFSPQVVDDMRIWDLAAICEQLEVMGQQHG